MISDKLVKPVDTKNKITTSDILQLKLQGMNLTEIGDKFGISKQAVSQRIKGVFKLLDNESLEAYQANKVKILTAVERALIDNLVNKDKLKQASLNNVAYAFGQINNAKRLEQGQPTDIFEVFTVDAAEQANLKELAKSILQRDVIDVTPDTDNIE